MNWEALGAIGEIVGAAGVIVSLLYLASQLESNSRQRRHVSAQAVLDKLNGLIGQLAFTAGAGDVWSRGLSGLDALKDTGDPWYLVDPRRRCSQGELRNRYAT